MNDALAAVVEALSKKVCYSSKVPQYKSSAPRTWLEWTPAQRSLCVQLFPEGSHTTLCCITGVERRPLPRSAPGLARYRRVSHYKGTAPTEF